MAVAARGNAKIEISTDGGTTYIALPQAEQISYKSSLGTIDLNHLDQTAVERIADLVDGSIDYTGYFVPGNTALASLRSANAAGTAIKVRVTFGDSANPEVITADAYVTDYNLTGSAGGVQELSCTFAATGPVT